MIGYVLFLIANAMLFVRPAELMPVLGDFQIYLFFIFGALLFSFEDLINQVKWRTLTQQPVNLCVIGMLIAIAVSRVSTGNVDGLEHALSGMIKVVLYYLVLVSVINTPQRFRTFLMTTAVCATFMIAYSIYDYKRFVAEMTARPDMAEVIYEQNKLPPHERSLLRHIPDRDGIDIYGNEIWFFRLCGLGIFHDPNDISLLIVATAVISVYFLTDRDLGPIRGLWVIPLVILGVAQYYTYSRGGLLALGAAGSVWLCTKYGPKVAIGIGLLGAAAAPIALGRAANMDLSGGTGQQRIQLWSDGLMAIRNSRILFGIGEGMYYDVAGHVAHNSYVHAFVELGIFGGTLFFGCLFLPAMTFFLMKRHHFRIDHPELHRLFPYVTAILADWSLGIASLSRCYTPSTYMIAGTCAAFINLVGFYRPRPRPLMILNTRTMQPWLACSSALLVGAYLFVRLFARWG